MPQPLLNIIRSGAVSVQPGLPVENTELCTAAMNVISGWAAIENTTFYLAADLVPGRALAIAELFASFRADAPKRALLNGLAEALMDDMELPIFRALLKRYDTCYSLRNPLAHWVMAHCKELPDAILSIDPQTYVKINAKHENVLTMMLKDVETKFLPRQNIRDHFSEDTLKAADAVYREHLEHIFVYRMPDFEGITAQYIEQLEWTQTFNLAVKMRVQNLHYPVRIPALRHIARKLGLPLPMEA